jgi:hypothetical protein
LDTVEDASGPEVVVEVDYNQHYYSDLSTNNVILLVMDNFNIQIDLKYYRKRWLCNWNIVTRTRLVCCKLLYI